MKSYYSSLTLGLVILSACQPLLQADPVDPVTAGLMAFGAALVTGVASVFGTRAYYKSDAHKAQEAEKEKKIVEGAGALFERMKKQGHRLLQHPQPSYQEIAQLHQGRELADLKDQMGNFLTTIREQKEQLRSVTGKYGEASQACYPTAQALHDDLVKFEQTIVHYQELLNKLDRHRDMPLVVVKNMEPFIQNVQSQVHTPNQFLNFVKAAYGAAVTKDEIKGLPLICAAEDISYKLVQLEQCKRKLEAHRQLLQKPDPILDARLTQLSAWEQMLSKATQMITSTHYYEEQVTINKIASDARLSLQAEHERERKERIVAEKALVDVKNHQQQLENEKARLAIEDKQALTNLANSTANAWSSSADLSKARERLADEKRARERVEEELRVVKNRVRELEQQIQLYNQRKADRRRQKEEESQEGYCRIHGCLSDRCPDLTCR